MHRTICLLVVCFAATGCTQTMRTSEPPAGTLGYGVKVLVNDGTCPEGQVKQITGGDNTRNIGRKRECVPMPAS